MNAVEVTEVSKRFGETVALQSVSFAVGEGELFGFIGPDGAGKSTLFRILTTLVVPDKGSATVLGFDVQRDLWKIRPRVGYMPGRFSLYPDLSIEENLRFFSSVFGTTLEKEIDRIAPIYDQLAPFRERRAGALSGGMKQKLALCCALVHRPEILFLDEPTTGVDAVSRREFWDLLGQLKATGLTIVVSTPYMDEADRCDRVALIQRGAILTIASPDAIRRAFGRPLFSVRSGDRYATLLAVRDYPTARSVFPFGETLHYTDARDLPHESIAASLRTFLSERGHDAAIEVIEPTIEDRFMDLMR
jgi:ABC-2 type transport system ATP-binding protein